MTELVDRLRTLVLRYPSDPDVRFVYADVLAEKGDPRGRFIRAQTALEQRLPPDAREAAQHEIRSLLGQHEKAWTEPASWADVRFQGGFIHAIRATIGSFLEHADALFAVEPVRKVVLRSVTDQALEKLAAHEALARIEQLSLEGAFGDAGAAAIAKSRHAASLRALNLNGCALGESFFAALGNLKALTSLAIPGLAIGDENAALLAKAPLAKLERLYAPRNELSDEGAAALAGAAQWSSLQWLCIGGNELSDEGADALAKAKFGNVTHLEINQTGIGDEGVLAIVKGKAFRQLKKIDVRQTEVSSEAIKQLRAKKLTVLGYAW